MTMPVAAGYPQMESLGSPEVWSPNLLIKFYEACTIGAVANTDWEGEIKKLGCKVHIRTTPDVTVTPYTKGQSITHQHLEPGKIELDIDKASKWDFLIDDVDRFQGDIDYMDDWTRDAAHKQKIYVDTLVLGDVYDDAAADNKGGTAGAQTGNIDLGTTAAPKELTKSTILEFIVDVGTVLDEQNVPDEDRALILPAWATGHIKKSDLKDASLTGDGVSVLRNGRIGMIDRFTIYQSNLLTSSGSGSTKYWQAMALQKSALTFASQFIENDVLEKVESTFGKVCRGLQVFGYKTVKPEAMAQLVIKRG